MEHFFMREERYRLIREEQHEYHMALPQEDSLKIMLEQFGKRAEQKAFADHYQKQNHYQQGGGYKGPYLHATVVNQRQHQQPPMGQKFQTGTSHTEVRYQQPMPHKLETAVVYHEGYYQQPAEHRAPYPRAGFGHQQGHLEQPNMRNQAAPVKTPGRVMDCHELAKLYGGVVVTETWKEKGKA